MYMKPWPSLPPFPGSSLSGTEFYSDAKLIHEDHKNEDGTDSGMVWVESNLATEGGVAIDTGGGNEVPPARCWLAVVVAALVGVWRLYVCIQRYQLRL